MNEYDDIADEAERLSDEELFDNMARPDWSKEALQNLQLEESDQDAMNGLIEAVDAAASAAEAKAAWINFGTTASDGLINLARKAITGK